MLKFFLARSSGARLFPFWKRRLEPISRSFGFDRGVPIDRYYIENFLRTHASDINGRVLEIAESAYTKKFGAHIEHVDVLHFEPGNPQATLIGDLETGNNIPANRFSCIVLTQTLPFVFKVRSAIRTCHSALAENGVLLATAPGISQISRYDMDRWGDYWRFTSLSVLRSFEEFFGKGNVEISSYGNVFSAAAFLYGLAHHELKPRELDFRDADYEVIIGIRAIKRKN